MSVRNKIRLNLANRLSLVFFSVFILTVAIIYLYVVPQLESKLTGQKLKELGNFTYSLYSEIFLTVYNQGASPGYLDLLTQRHAEQSDARILLVDGNGNLIADSFKGQSYNRDDYPIINLATESRQVVTEVNKVGGRNYGMAAVPLVSGSRTVGVIVVSSSMSDVESAVSLVQRQLTIAAAVALVLALSAIYLVSHILVRRIRRIETGAIRIAQGDFATRVPVSSQDELGQLANTFNDMGDRLGSAFKRIDVEKQRAKLLLDDLSEGVIGIDTEGNVIVANPAAEQLLGREIVPPVLLSDCVPEEIFDLWRSMSPDRPHRDDTFMLAGEQALKVHTSFLSDQAELESLLVLRDVSQEVKLERSRRDFIANASHELKTPLFSLAGFLEIMQDEEVDEQTKKEFVATMREQVERLAGLARDLLDLSQIDSGAVSVQAGRVDIREVIDSVAREFTAHSVTGDSRIDTASLPEGLAASCDRDRAAQLVRILLDNALKYSPPDTTVEVTGSGNGKTVAFTVVNHGSGITEEELPRLFERFYRGRSAGRIRGTGLGLSIARELARLMNGTVEVASSKDSTSFTVTLPANGSVDSSDSQALAG